MKRFFQMIMCLSLFLVITPVEAQSKVMYVYTGQKNGMSLSYNKYGLLVKADNHRKHRVTFTYDKRGYISKMKIYNKTQGDQPLNTTVTFKVNHKGLVTSYRFLKKTTKCIYNKANLLAYSTRDKRSQEYNHYKYYYDKKGRMTKAVDLNTKEVTMYSYDRHGYITYILTQQDQYKSGTIYDNVYNKKGLLIYSTLREGTKTPPYQYKKIKVAKKYLREVKRQQEALLGYYNRQVIYLTDIYTTNKLYMQEQGVSSAFIEMII